MIQKYRPENSFEWLKFSTKYCDKCTRDNPDENIYCDILSDVYLYGLHEPEYPHQWRYHPEKNEPICTDFEDERRK